MGLESIFLKQIKRVRNQKKTYEFSPPQHHEMQMTRQESHELAWNDFKEKMRPLCVFQMPNGLECIVISKYAPWSRQDVSLFAGTEQRGINEVFDFENNEGSSFFDINFYLAKDILSNDDVSKMNVTIGFNPEDFSLGHHSVKRLHSHVYVSEGEKLEGGAIKETDWKSLEKPERLMFVEPFSAVYHDQIKKMLEAGLLNRNVLESEISEHIGYIGFEFTPGTSSGEIFEFTKKLYTACKSEYDAIADCFIKKQTDSETERFAPRDREERWRLLIQYLDRNKTYSDESQKLLESLAERLESAMDPNKAMWFTRGFSGAITFIIEKDNPSIRMHFLPRVVTTSGVEKTIFGSDHPTRIKRSPEPATGEDRKIMYEYQEQIKMAAQRYEESRLSI